MHSPPERKAAAMNDDEKAAINEIANAAGDQSAVDAATPGPWRIGAAGDSGSPCGDAIRIAGARTISALTRQARAGSARMAARSSNTATRTGP
jgi:hypothetical protein